MNTATRKKLGPIAAGFFLGVICTILASHWRNQPAQPAPPPQLSMASTPLVTPPPEMDTQGLPAQGDVPLDPATHVPQEPHWETLNEEIRNFTGSPAAAEELARVRSLQFENNPAAFVSIQLAAADWAERHDIPNAPVKMKAAINATDFFLIHCLIWRLESRKYESTICKESKELHLQRIFLEDMKRICDEEYIFCAQRARSPKDVARLRKLYDYALDGLKPNGEILDLLWTGPGDDPGHHRFFMNSGEVILSETIRTLPEHVPYSLLSEEDSKVVAQAIQILTKYFDDRSNQAKQLRSMMIQAENDEMGPRITSEQLRGLPGKPIEEPSVPIVEPMKTSQERTKEYRDLTADPPLPKAGEKAPPKPPEEKFVPYLKDPANKDPKAGGLGLSLEVLTDLTRADLGPLPFPLPLQLSGLEGARHPQPPPPGMMSDQAKTRVTYKARRALMNYLQKQAGRDIPTNYGKVDAPIIVYDSLTEYMEHKGDKKECYFLIGRNLEHAQRLLLEDPIQIRRCGVGLAEKATIFLLGNMDDKPLAMAIIDLYVMPYLHLGHKRREDHLSKHHLLGSAMAIYSWSDFPDKMQLAAEEVTRDAADQNGQDAGRYAIAKALVRQKKIDEAIAVLGQITDRSLAGGAKLYAESLRKQHPGPAKP
jgi:hypothetical protein